ncbi:hypothetical protein D3C76_371480 [compost metagenome]
MLHRILGQRRAFIAGLQRHSIGQRPLGDHDTCRVGGCMAGHAFDLHRHVEQSFDLRIAVVQRLQLRSALQCPAYADAELPRNELRRLVHLVIRQIQHTSHVPHRRSRGHGSEGDDLCHMLFPVFIHHIGNDLIAPLVTEVDIDIRHRDALRIEKPFKEQIILQWVHIGDPQAISSQAACRGASSRTGNDALPVAEGDEVPDDQKIITEPHTLNNAQLIGQPLPGGIPLLR